MMMNLIDPEQPPKLCIEAAVCNGGQEVWATLSTKMKLDQDHL